MFNFRGIESTYNITLEESIVKLKTSTGFNKDILEITQEGLLDNFVQILKNTFNTLRLSVKQLLKIKAKKIKFNSTNLTKLKYNPVFKINYFNLIDLGTKIEGPAGLNSLMIDYVNANAKVVNAISNINAIVNQLRIDLGKIVSTPGGINEPSLFDEIHYILKDKEIKDSLEELSNLRKGDQHSNTYVYGEVFRNNNEFLESIETIKKSVDIINNVDHANLNKNIDACMNYVNDILSMSNDGYSKVLIKKVGDSVALVAESIEAYSGIVYNTEMLATVMQRNSDVLLENTNLIGK